MTEVKGLTADQEKQIRERLETMDKKALIKFLKTKGEERKQKLYEALQFQIADAEDTKKYFSGYNQTLADKQTSIEQIKKTSTELKAHVKECRREREGLNKK